VDTVEILRVVFAVSIGVAAGALAAAWLDRLREPRVYWVAALVGLGAVAGWIVFALDGRTELAVAAAGLTVSFLVTLAAAGVSRGVVHAHRVDSELKQAEARLAEAASRGTEERTAEIERTLARARAESISLLADEERRIGEERRAVIAERERSAAHELNDALEATQRRVEQRLADWTEDLERAQADLFEQLQRLGARQTRLIEEAEERLAADAERLEAESEGQRAALVKLRGEVEQAAEEAIARASAELETYGVERRQALNELTDRLHRRERDLREMLDREQTEAIHGIQTTFTDVERRLVERLERVVDRTTAQYADAAALRLSRELDRAVESFSHEAENVISERIASAGQSAAQRLDQRLAEANAQIATRRDELVAAVEQRLGSAERELRVRLDELAADADAQRGILEARLFELQRRIEAALAHVEALDA
jgi:hypothetical protein